MLGLTSGLQQEKARERAELAERKKAALARAARLGNRLRAPKSAWTSAMSLAKLGRTPTSSGAPAAAQASSAVAGTPSLVSAAGEGPVGSAVGAPSLVSDLGAAPTQSIGAGSAEVPSGSPRSLVETNAPAQGMHRIHIVKSDDSPHTQISHLDESMRLQWVWLRQSPRAAAFILALRRVMHGNVVVAFISVLIVANTVVLGLDKYPLWPEEMVRVCSYEHVGVIGINFLRPLPQLGVFETINFFMTLVFALEAVLKFVARARGTSVCATPHRVRRCTSVGVRVYLRDRFNVFDVFIVVISLVDLSLNPPSLLTGTVLHSKGPATALRALRLFRVFKLARSWVSLRELLGTIARTLMDLANFTVLLLLILYIFALFGMQIFANRLSFDANTNLVLTNITSAPYISGDVPRCNFNGLLFAITGVFQARHAPHAWGGAHVVMASVSADFDDRELEQRAL